MNHSRRTFLGRILGGAGLVALGSPLAFLRTVQAKSTRAVQAAGNLLKTPQVIGTGQTLTLSSGTIPLAQGISGKMYTYGPMFPAPLFRMKQGEQFAVNIINTLSEDANIHWHGLLVPSEMDGHPMNSIKPNQNFTYSFPVRQRAGMYFYHSHAHEKTAEHVHKGMYGLFVIGDDEENALGLPSGEREVLMAIQDVRFDGSGVLEYTPDMTDEMNGWMGNTVMVNSTPNAYLPVSRDYYRLRLVNASNARVYKLAFNDGRNFFIIGSDGGLLDKPYSVTSATLAPSERLDILVDFSGDPINTSVTLISQAYQPPPPHMGVNPLYPQGIALDILRFDVLESAKSTFTVPTALSSIQRIDPITAKRTRRFVTTMIMKPGIGMFHEINNKVFEMMRIDETVQFGDTEIWEFYNEESDMFHPMHVHGVQFQILTRNGSTDLPPAERGWKDSFLLYPEETVRVAIRFNDYEGMFMVHCHNLQHEDAGMMQNFMIESPSGVDDQTTRSASQRLDLR